MAIINGYTTLAGIKASLNITSTNATDDAVLNDLITQASRYIDRATQRTFYPRVETRSFNTPYGRELVLDDDLLAVTTVLNGDGDEILAADYIVWPVNGYPKYAIRLISSSSEYWEMDANDNYEGVIDITGWWGFHSQYSQRAWSIGSTLNEGGVLNATDLTFTVSAGTLFTPGQVIKIDSELMNITTVATNDPTVAKRGDNGSTAATHVDTSVVYYWNPEPDIELACRMIVNNMYHNRFGQNASTTATITGAGVVLAPEDVPASATAILKVYARLC